MALSKEMPRSCLTHRLTPSISGGAVQVLNFPHSEVLALFLKHTHLLMAPLLCVQSLKAQLGVSRQARQMRRKSGHLTLTPREESDVVRAFLKREKGMGIKKGVGRVS